MCVHSCRHDALTSGTSQSRTFSCILCTWRSGFRVARRAWRSRVRIPGRRFEGKRRIRRGPTGSEVPSRQQSERSGPNCARSVPKWCRFGTLLYRIRFGTVRYTSNPTLVQGACLSSLQRILTVKNQFRAGPARGQDRTEQRTHDRQTQGHGHRPQSSHTKAHDPRPRTQTSRITASTQA